MLVGFSFKEADYLHLGSIGSGLAKPNWINKGKSIANVESNPEYIFGTEPNSLPSQAMDKGKQLFEPTSKDRWEVHK